MSIEEEAFEVLHQNLAVIKPEYSWRDIILCPICLSEICKDDVLRFGIEHIVPKIIVKNDGLKLAGAITKNQRCGITVLCRQPRTYGKNNKRANHGCNGLKGSVYDWALGRVFKGNAFDPSKFTHRHYVAILIMGYLGAFQTFGYEYILRPELDEIRKQFDYPDTSMTNWLGYIKVFEKFHGVFTTENGMPFMVGGVSHEDAALVIMFRQFSVALPGGYQQLSNFTRDIDALLRG